MANKMTDTFENRIIDTAVGKVHVSRIVASFINVRQHLTDEQKKTMKYKLNEFKYFNKYLKLIGVTNEDDVSNISSFFNNGKLELEILVRNEVLNPSIPIDSYPDDEHHC